MNANTKLI